MGISECMGKKTRTLRVVKICVRNKGKKIDRMSEQIGKLKMETNGDANNRNYKKWLRVTQLPGKYRVVPKRTNSGPRLLGFKSWFFLLAEKL